MEKILNKPSSPLAVAPDPAAQAGEQEQVIERFNAGNAAWRAQDWGGALAAYGAALALAPEFELALLGRARARENMVQYPRKSSDKP